MKHIVVINPYFFPGYEAGGPIQSIVNLIDALHKEYHFYVITAAYDLNAKNPYADIPLDQWTAVDLNGIFIQCFYASGKLSKKALQQLIAEAQAHCVFINGLYSHSFFWTPLSLAKQWKAQGIHTIVSPRGMLQQSNLAIKSYKKKPYLQLIKWLGWTHYISWHATDLQEVNDIKKNFSNHAVVKVAGNIPKQPKPMASHHKSPDQLRLVFLSLISPKKNLLTTIELVKECGEQVCLDIFGPIKDQAYWQKCLQAIGKEHQNKIQYKGTVTPDRVQTVLSEYDAMILLTRGENFGHAIFESFSVGVPVIISHFTPWHDLQKNKAGWNVEINDANAMVQLFNALAAKTQEEWKPYCDGALRYAQTYFQQQDFSEAYKALFK